MNIKPGKVPVVLIKNIEFPDRHLKIVLRTPTHLVGNYFYISYKNKNYPCIQIENKWYSWIEFKIWNPMRKDRITTLRNETLLLKLENFLLKQLVDGSLIY